MCLCYLFRRRFDIRRRRQRNVKYTDAKNGHFLTPFFGEYLQTELRNQFVFGLKNQKIQSRLLETANLTKEPALKTACGMELAVHGVNKLKEENSAETTVDFVGTGAKQKKS